MFIGFFLFLEKFLKFQEPFFKKVLDGIPKDIALWGKEL